MFANALVNIGNAGGGAQAVAVHPSKHACDGNKRKLEECFASSLEKSPAIKGVLAGAGDEFYRRSEFVLANRAYAQSLKTLVPLEEGAEESSDDEGATDSIAVRTFAPTTEAGEEDKGFFAAPLTAKNAQIRNDDLARACLTGMVMIQGAVGQLASDMRRLANDVALLRGAAPVNPPAGGAAAAAVAVAKPTAPAELSRAVQDGVALLIVKDHFVSLKPQNGVRDVSMIVSGKAKSDAGGLLKQVFPDGIPVRHGAAATTSVDVFVGTYVLHGNKSMHAGLNSLFTSARTAVNATAVKVFSAHGSETANRLAYFDEDGDTFDFEKTAVSVLVQAITWTCIVANNTTIKVDVDMPFSDLLPHMATLSITYKTVAAYLLVCIIKSGKFDVLGSQLMGISDFKQAHLYWFIVECFCVRWARQGKCVFRGVEVTAGVLQEASNADNVSEQAVRKMSELEALLGVTDGTAKVEFAKKYTDFFFVAPPVAPAPMQEVN